MNFPEYVKGERQQIIFGFLSHLADHFEKNTFWIKSQHTIYKGKLNNIPEVFLRRALWQYLGSDNMRITNKSKFAPSIANVLDYVKACQGFKQHWLTVPLDQTFCRSCRTDDIGKAGGYRHIFYYGFRPDIGRIGEMSAGGHCDCELGRKMSGASYEDVMIKMQQWDPNAQIAVSRWCNEQGRKLQAREQTNYHWDNIIAQGYVRYGIDEHGEDTDRLYPIWEHPFWRSPFGAMSANLYGFDMPADLSAQVPHQNLTAQRKHGKLRRLRSELAQESTTDRVMRQMGDFSPK